MWLRINSVFLIRNFTHIYELLTLMICLILTNNKYHIRGSSITYFHKFPNLGIKDKYLNLLSLLFDHLELRWNSESSWLQIGLGWFVLNEGIHLTPLNWNSDARDIVFIAQMPHVRQGIQLEYSTWFQFLLGFLEIEMLYGTENEQGFLVSKLF